MITSEEFGGVVRAVVAGVGGFLVGKGYIDAETAALIGGAVVTIGVAIWSIVIKRKAA